MKETTEMVLELATRITESAVNNLKPYPDEQTSKDIASFFETFFNKINALAQAEE